MLNKVVAFELPINNMKRASAFYRKAFGWKAARGNDSSGIVTVPENGNWVYMEKKTVDDELPRAVPQDGKPILVVFVTSIEPTLAKVKRAGGQVLLEKVAYNNWGWYARIKDSEGNIFGLWELMK